MEFKMSLNVVAISDAQFDIMLDEKFRKSYIRLALYLAANFNVNTGSIHRLRVSELARQTGVQGPTCYQFIKDANTCGFANLKIKNLKLTGKLKHFPKLRWKAEDEAPAEINQMKVAIIHRDGIRTLMDGDATGSQMRLALAMAFRCDIRTGNIHEKHPCTWAEIIRRDRTTVTRGLQKLNEIGYLQTKTDYVVEGRLPWTAFARGWFAQQKIAQQKIAKGGAELKAKVEFLDAQRWLREGYGLCADFLKSRSNVLAAAKALGGLSAKKPKGRSRVDAPERLTEGRYTSREVFQDLVNRDIVPNPAG